MAASFFLMAAAVLVLTFDFVAIRGGAYNHLLAGDTLKNGESLWEDDYRLLMQPDCNLVLYEENPHTAIWSSQTANQGNMCEATLKKDGNFVINDRNGTLIAHTATNKTEGNYVFLLQRDRKIVIYSEATWSSGTNIDDQTTAAAPNNEAIGLRNRGGLNALMLLGACVWALLF